MYKYEPCPAAQPPDAAPSHTWEGALLSAHQQLVLRWLPLIGMQMTQIMCVLLNNLVEGRRVAKISQKELGRICGRDERQVRRYLASLHQDFNLLRREKRQNVSGYVITERLLPDFLEGDPGSERRIHGPLFSQVVPFQTPVNDNSDRTNDGPACPVRPDTHVRSEVDGEISDRTPMSGQTGHFRNPHKEDTNSTSMSGQTGHFDGMHKEERARAVVVVELNTNTQLTTTTNPDCETEKIADLLLGELRRLDPAASTGVARRIASSCQSRAPTISPEECLEMVRLQIASFRNRGNPIGTLVVWAKEYFAAADLEPLRVRRRQQEERRQQQQVLQREFDTWVEKWAIENPEKHDIEITALPQQFREMARQRVNEQSSARA